jgi:hypothetical protein
MNIKQAAKLYGVEGTKRLRKEWQIAKNNGKTPNKHLQSNKKQT